MDSKEVTNKKTVKKHKGVDYCKYSNKYIAKVKIGINTCFLGGFDTVEEANNCIVKYMTTIEGLN